MASWDYEDQAGRASLRKPRRASEFKVAPTPQVVGRKEARLGIERMTRLRAFPSELTEQQAKCFAALTVEPQRPCEIAAKAGLSTRQVGDALRRLSAKDHTIKTSVGWRLA